MTSRCAALALSALALLVPLPTLADWQYAEWGSSPEEVRAAAGGQAIDNPGLDVDGPTPEESPLAAPYRGSGIDLTAYFLFDSPSHPPGLAAVGLVPENPEDCDQVRQELARTYGASPSGAPQTMWDDPTNEAEVTFRGDSSECSVLYTWKMPPGAKGGL